MHEHTIAATIIAQAEEHGNVKKIVVEVGDLAHLPAEEMKHVLEDMTDWEIEIERRPALVLCEACNFEGEPLIKEHMHDHAIYDCANCGAALPKILEGHDIILTEVIVDDEEETSESEEE
ncbi:hydrogenase maturation nickel metallochaperone HypA [Candidatus Woesearchaeota archaeon]|nr:hydrogenase maturation nickel metallochaperone HypA [Nanoarchaeota archaeon]MCB9370891.1 hydrogenase maturation nickel metallochaperone HypA [Candidatus Woesearchaeota archaeon]USN43992.1 MAG: hydrogenase maturation nickel metallochaperone HypA [Candidatus Woesearchaeota archaeon]